MRKFFILTILMFSMQVKAIEWNAIRHCPKKSELYCDLSGKPVSGVAIDHYPNGNLKLIVPFIQGKREGLGKLYYDDGNLEAEIIFKNDKEYELRKGYYKNGNLKFEATFRNNKENGEFKGYSENGKLIFENVYKNGKLEGLEKFYYDNGNLRTEVMFINDKAISGYAYDEYGKKQEMTNAHLYQINSGRKRQREWLDNLVL